MKEVEIQKFLQNLYQPPTDSHKGQNGKLLIIGGSSLFHAASLWALKIASRLVDMVFYSSVPENNEIVERVKEEFRDGIVVRREDLDHYIKEADCVLIGCGMMRRDIRVDLLSICVDKNLHEINKLPNEGEQTYCLTKYVLENYKDKRFVLDAGALQELDLTWLKNLKELPILTPHQTEFENLNLKFEIQNLKEVIILKGPTDKIYSPNHDPIEIAGGVPGMTKGGTGDVLAGMTAAFYCKNDALTSAVAASFFNKKAGEDLFKKVGNNFNASDLVDQLPQTIKNLQNSL